jgi:hypothetical protein
VEPHVPAPGEPACQVSSRARLHAQISQWLVVCGQAPWDSTSAALVAVMKPMPPGSSVAGSASPAFGMFPLDRSGFSVYRARHSPANIRSSDKLGCGTKWPA